MFMKKIPALLFVALLPMLLGAAPASYHLTVTKEGIGTGTVTDDSGNLNCGATCSYDYFEGTTVVLTATADTGWQFYEWGGFCAGSEATCAFDMDSDIAVTARFGCVQDDITLIGTPCGYNGNGLAIQYCDGGVWFDGCNDPDQCTDGTSDCNGNTFRYCELSGITGHFEWTETDCADEYSCTDDTCDPTGGCQHDASAEGTICRDAAGLCDAIEYCDGSYGDCPFDLKSTGLCRDADGSCDVAEYCDGIANTCPSDGVAGDSVVCREAVGLCDAAEHCTGSAKTCPADGVKGIDAVCRPADGDCDVADHCDGANKACPVDEFKDNSVVCRPAVDAECDLAENCPGDGPDCPADAFAAVNTPCGDSVTDTLCDNPDACDGNGNCLDHLTPADTIVCHDSTGPCDPAEYCDGAGNCPVDQLAGTDVVCRASTSDCDADEYCDGATAACPAEDYTSVNGAECVDGYDYTEDESCQNGACTGTEMIGSCADAYAVTTFPYTLESTTIGRPSHIDDYGLNCPLSNAPLGDAVIHVPMNSNNDYEISITRHGGWTGFIAVIPMCTEFFTNTTCLNSNSAADSFTYSPAISGNATIVIESNSAEGDFTLTIEEIAPPQPDNVIIPDDDAITPTDDLVSDDLMPDEDEMIVDEQQSDELTTDELLTDEEETDDAPVIVDDGAPLADDTVTPDQDFDEFDWEADHGADKDTVTPTDNEATDEEQPDEMTDELGADSLVPATDTDKPKDDGCGCSLVF